MSTIIRGIDCALTIGSSSFTGVKEVTLTAERNEADVTTRASGGIATSAVTTKKFQIDIVAPYDTSQAAITTLESNFNTGSSVAVGMTNSNITLSANFGVFKFERSEPIDGVVSVSITLKPVP
jgi:hypothetical protein